MNNPLSETKLHCEFVAVVVAKQQCKSHKNHLDIV